jgi:hypothetical protein
MGRQGVAMSNDWQTIWLIILTVIVLVMLIRTR